MTFVRYPGLPLPHLVLVSLSPPCLKLPLGKNPFPMIGQEDPISFKQASVLYESLTVINTKTLLPTPWA